VAGVVTFSTEWAAFARSVAARLAAGARVYHDQSFSRPPTELADEIAEELLDVAGWAFILWTRVRQIRARVDAP
jgi:hypothetical protein